MKDAPSATTTAAAVDAVVFLSFSPLFNIGCPLACLALSLSLPARIPYAEVYGRSSLWLCYCSSLAHLLSVDDDDGGDDDEGMK